MASPNTSAADYHAQARHYLDRAEGLAIASPARSDALLRSQVHALLALSAPDVVDEAPKLTVVNVAPSEPTEAPAEAPKPKPKRKPKPKPAPVETDVVPASEEDMIRRESLPADPFEGMAPEAGA